MNLRLQGLVKLTLISLVATGIVACSDSMVPPVPAKPTDPVQASPVDAVVGAHSTAVAPQPVVSGIKPVSKDTKVAAPIPQGFIKYGSLLGQQLDAYWSDMPYRASMAAQVEQETCVSLKSKVCWTPLAKLQTSSELGFGFGQTTIAYNADGTERFNTWKELRKTNGVALKDWTWENRLDPTLSMRGFVLYDWQSYRVFIKSSQNPRAVLAFTYAGYNGGPSGTLKEIAMCRALPECTATEWNSVGGKKGVSSVSNKSRVAKKGYGQSAFDTNRGYVQNVMVVRVKKYEPYFKQQ